MHRLELTQVQVAERGGLKQPVVSRALSGEMNNVETKTIVALAKGAGCEPWELLRPDGAQSAPASASPSDELVGLIRDLLDASPAQRKALRAVLNAGKATPKAQSKA